MSQRLLQRAQRNTNGESVGEKKEPLAQDSVLWLLLRAAAQLEEVSKGVLFLQSQAGWLPLAGTLCAGSRAPLWILESSRNLLCATGAAQEQRKWKIGRFTLCSSSLGFRADFS